MGSESFELGIGDDSMQILSQNNLSNAVVIPKP